MSRATSKELFLTLNGVDHWVRKIGNCNRDVPPLLIIHGGPGGNNYVFERTIGPFLENFWPVIYYEQRGCGRSAAPENKEAYSKEILVTDILELCQKLSLRRIIPLGYSFGAELTMELALHAPHLISKMILQSPSIDDQERIGLVQVI